MDSQKLQYLLTKLSGNALSVFNGIPPTAENYKIIYDTLVEKYDDKRSLATHYFDQILQFKSGKQESVEHLNWFVDKLGSNVSALKALGLPDL
ncbi:hypothetical protein WDU94_007609 [Cyamophila willieti]